MSIAAPARTSLSVPQACCYLPVSSRALPAIFFCLIMSTTTPQAQRASSCPTKPAPSWLASPFSADEETDPVQTALCLPDRHQQLAADCPSLQAEHAICLALLAAMLGGWHSPSLAVTLAKQSKAMCLAR